MLATFDTVSCVNVQNLKKPGFLSLHTDLVLDSRFHSCTQFYSFIYDASDFMRNEMTLNYGDDAVLCGGRGELTRE